MKKYNKLNIIQLIIILVLSTTNYFSYFHHQAFVELINNSLYSMQSNYIIIINKIEIFILWLISQNYDFNFNNRELAFGVIFLLALSLMFYSKNIRIRLIRLLKALFNKHFIRIYLEIMFYTGLMVYILYKLSYWEFKYTKDTFIWILFTAIYLSFKFADNKGDDKLFLNLLKNTIGITMAFEFLHNIYTFPLLIEIIILLILLFLGIMIGFTDVFPDEDKEGKVTKLMIGINTYIGVNILIFLVIEVINNYHTLLTIETLKSFLLPIIFTLLFIPYLIYLATWITYDTVNVPIRLNRVSGKKVILYFKIRMFLHCKMNKKKIEEIRKGKYYLIINMKNIEDVNKIFA